MAARKWSGYHVANDRVETESEKHDAMKMPSLRFRLSHTHGSRRPLAEPEGEAEGEAQHPSAHSSNHSVEHCMYPVSDVPQPRVGHEVSLLRFAEYTRPIDAQKRPKSKTSPSRPHRI
eukprot:1428221-Prymnesium_polylepis.1